jgi:hypothetical protein
MQFDVEMLYVVHRYFDLTSEEHVAFIIRVEGKSKSQHEAGSKIYKTAWSYIPEEGTN